MHGIDFHWGSAPDPAGGANSAPQIPLAVFEGPTSKARGRQGKGRERVHPPLIRHSESGEGRKKGKEASLGLGRPLSFRVLQPIA